MSQGLRVLILAPPSPDTTILEQFDRQDDLIAGERAIERKANIRDLEYRSVELGRNLVGCFCNSGDTAHSAGAELTATLRPDPWTSVFGRPRSGARPGSARPRLQSLASPDAR
jgi:hypothetical protein